MCARLLGTEPLLQPWDESGQFPSLLIQHWLSCITFYHSNHQKPRLTRIWCTQKECNRFWYLEMGAAVTNTHKCRGSFLEVSSGQKLDEFEDHDTNCQDCNLGSRLNRLWVEIWILNSPVVRAQTEVRSRTERENTNFLREYLNHCEQMVRRIRDVNGPAGEGSEGNEEHADGKCEGRWSLLHSGRKLSRIGSYSSLEKQNL